MRTRWRHWSLPVKPWLRLSCASALDRAGIPACGLDATRIGLITDGPVLDASPRKLDAAAIQIALEGTCPSSLCRVSLDIAATEPPRLLGRGGSDLTALYLAQQLKASRCLLIKDVDGLYEWDPAEEGPSPRRYRELTWDDALGLTGRIVQHKAVQFAQDHGLSFEVTTLGGEGNGTVIGAGPHSFSRGEAVCATSARWPARLGHGRLWRVSGAHRAP